MSGATKVTDLQASVTTEMDSSAMETEEYYNQEGEEWSQKVDTGQLCRVCANPNEYLIPIFDGEGLEHELAMKIQKHLPIKVTEADTLPLHICYQCASTLIAWHDLVISCVEADKKLRELQVEDEDDDDKGAEMFESHSMDSDGVDEVDQPSTSETQSQVTKTIVLKKASPSKEKKPKLKMVLVKGPPAGTSGQKTGAKVQVAKIAEQAKTKEGGNEDPTSERCHPSPLMSFRAFLDTQNPWRALHKMENILDTPIDIKTEDHILESRPNCSSCGMYFNNNAELAIHLSVSHSSKVFHCNVCDAIFFNSKAIFMDHIKHHYSGSLRGKRKKYVCKVCSIAFTTNLELKSHMKIHKPEKENGSKGVQIQCTYCNKFFTRKLELKKHIMNTHNIKTEETIICDDELDINIAIKEEIVPIDIDERIHFVGESDQMSLLEYPCSVCSKVFIRRNDLIKHRKWHTMEEMSQADSIFIDDNDNDNADDYLFSHTKIPLEIDNSKHSKKEQDEISRAKVEINGRTVYRCTQCNKHIVTRYSYIRHLRIHTGEKPFTCHVCGKQFRVQALLSRHVREVHDRIRNHPCDICGRRFANSNARNDHRRTHTGERPCVCHLCGKAFKTKASLFVHSKFHSDVFPHPCPHCDKRFRRRQQLNIHMLHHTGEKPHTCRFCGKSFRLSKTLKDHTLIHTNKETFECPICGKRFAQERYLKNHARNHRLRITNRNIMVN